eukprot:TRINITY_DN8197_c0_g1_i2.p1 TRINITY_DN8197_c0_g1~~TRINITY_DN8197_c0_g1_i2.p1  ORF type:complete len:769 (+),score=91.06 TRINITY_DN8197_c0_g1_i2:61-2367(+)
MSFSKVVPESSVPRSMSIGRQSGVDRQTRSRSKTSSGSYSVLSEGSRVFVVQPSDEACVLAGQMMLNKMLFSRYADKRLPYVIASLAVHLVIIGTFTGALMEVTKNPNGITVVLHTPLSILLNIMAVMLAFFVLFLTMHMVHRPLAWKILTKSLSPAVFIMCCLRAWGSWVSSRYVIIHGSPGTAVDCAVLVSWLSTCVTVILLEAAHGKECSSESRQRAWQIKSCLLMMTFLTPATLAIHATLHRSQTHWDPASIALIWLAPMSPRSQYISACVTMSILSAKGAFLLFAQKGDFMFYSASYVVREENINQLFSSIDKDADGQLDYAEWCNASATAGIPKDCATAGFFALCADGASTIDFEDFNSAMLSIMRSTQCSVDRCLHLWCQDAHASETKTESFPKMISIMKSQWAQVNIQSFSMRLYSYILSDPASAQLFKGKNIAFQATALAGFVSMSISWLKDWSSLSIESELYSLGKRHFKYGVHQCSLSSFPIWVYDVIEAELKVCHGDLPGNTWLKPWIHFIIVPMMDGLLGASGLSKQELAKSALKDFEMLRQTNFLDSLFEELSLSVPRLLQLFPSASLIQHKQVVLNFLCQLLTNLGQGNREACRRRIKAVALLHARHTVDLTDILHFVQSFLKVMCSKLGDLGMDCDEQASRRESWAYLFIVEFVDTHILSAFASDLDMMSDVFGFLEVKDELEYEDWHTLTSSRGLLVEDVIHTSFKEIQKYLGSPVPGARLARVLQNACLYSPGVDFASVVMSLAKPKLAL